MEGLVVFNSENAVSGDKPKGKDGGTGTATGIAGRKKLAEITNLPCPPKLSSQFEQKQTVSLSAKEFFHQLQNENLSLKKVLMDRNKLIESNRIELHKLRINLEKVQLQNMQLAQANSQLLQELNSGKDRLKALQHELGCKNGMLKTLKLEENALLAARQDQLDEAETIKSAKGGILAQLDNKKKDGVRDKFSDSDRRGQSNRPLALSHSVKVVVRKKAESQEDNEFPMLPVDSSLPRRQSTRLKCEDSKTNKDASVINKFEVPICSVTADPACGSSGALDHSIRKVGAKKKAVNQDACSRRQSMRFKLDVTQTSETEKVQVLCIGTAETLRDDNSDISKLVKEENIEVNELTTESQVYHRHPTGRPLRHAAVRIQSYKEVPINVKMRRPE